MPEPKPTVGRIVHYCIGTETDGSPVYRPAIIVQGPGTGEHPNLQVFLDGSNDRRYRERAEIEYDAFAKAHPGALTSEAALRLSDLGLSSGAGPSPDECARGAAWRTSVSERAGVGGWRWPPRES